MADLVGSTGNDLLTGGTAADSIEGGSGDDTLDGGAGRDNLQGEAGNDSLVGGDGADTLIGGDGDDTLKGGDFGDFISGGAGNDFLQGNKGNDTLNGNEGDDTIIGGQGSDVLRGGKGNDVIIASNDGDFINGNIGNDNVVGGIGNDTIHGGQGDDTVTGGAGDDMIIGDKGNDVLIGGEGNDIFVINNEAGTSNTIADFSAGETINISAAGGTFEELTITDSADGAVIDIGNGQTITVAGMVATDIGETVISFDTNLDLTAAQVIAAQDDDTDDTPAVVAAVNVAPTLADVDAPTFNENTVNASAQIIDSAVTFADADSTDLDGGNLTITYSVGGAAQDSLSIKNIGTGTGQISYDGTTASYEGTAIGTINGGNNGATGGDLILDLNSDATIEAVDALLQAITYANSDDSPTATRTISITIADGDGGTSAAEDVVITVTAENEPLAFFNLNVLDGTDGFRLDGEIASAYSGFSASSAGDVNGDGFDDVIVGAYQANPNGSYEGASYVVFGKASGFSDSTNLSALDGSDGFRLEGVVGYGYNGYSVSSAGDVNGDGFDDVIVGALRATNPNGTYAGSAYVVFGKSTSFGATVNLSVLDGADGFRLDAIADYDNITSVKSAGDVNGDGFDDVIVGSPNADINGGSSGSSYVVFGKSAGFSDTIDLSSLDGTDGFRIDGDNASDKLGESVSSAGDVNGDGFDDLIIGAFGVNSQVGSSYVVFGKSAGFSDTIDLSSLDGTDGFRLDGENTSDQSGLSVSSVGDINGDGFDDMIVGANSADPNSVSGSGSSYVVFGKSAGFSDTIDLADLDGTDGFRLDGVAADDLSGYRVNAAGDFNGDGFGDIIIGAYQADNNTSGSGSSYVVFGKSAGFTDTIDLADLDGTDGFRLDGENAYDLSGLSVSSAGDVNGDGFDDIIIGAYSADNSASESGSSYVVFGNNNTNSVSHLGTTGNDTLTGDATANVMNGGLGDDVITGLGGADVIKGANGDDTITGGAGVDRMWGGSGEDDFVYTSGTESGTGAGNRDIIYDFVSGVDDIDISLLTGSFNYLGTNAFTGGNNEVRYDATGKDLVIQVDSNADGAADFEIELIDANSLVVGDIIGAFIVI